MWLPAPLLLAAALVAPPSPGASAAEGLAADPLLTQMVGEALAHSPEYAQAKAELSAEEERVPQAGALPDPTVTLGIQNDGFRGLEIGTMETSFWQVMVTQPLPWPGKRVRREEAARAQASTVEERMDKIRLATAAEVERAYVDLLLVRGQAELLVRLEGLWKEAEATVRSRYEVGTVPQSDLLRAQLERTRLMQRRIALELAERSAVETLNRLRGHPLDEPIATERRLAEVALPPLPPLEEVVADAEERSPDLALARRGVLAAERKVLSARQERWPDFTVSAGIMPRGHLDPMWTASVGIAIPIFSRKDRAVAEEESRKSAGERGEDATRQVVDLRAQERYAALEAARKTLALYTEALLVQSDAAVKSTLAQYRVGKVPFAAVLEVMRGLVADEAGHLQVVADGERIVIAMQEVSLEAPAGMSGGGGFTGGTVPGTSGGAMASGGPAGGASSGGEGAPAAGGSSGGTSSGM